MNTSQDFFATIASMHQRQNTGALFGITDNDRMLVVFLAEGNIKGLRFGRLTGNDVIAELATVELKSFSIKPDKSLPAQADLPATVDILQSLAARMPAAALATSTDAATDISAAQSDAKPTMMYRGQVVAAEEPPAAQSSAKPKKMMYRGQVVGEEPPAAQPTSKPKMMYRGQVVG